MVKIKGFKIEVKLHKKLEYPEIIEQEILTEMAEVLSPFGEMLLTKILRDDTDQYCDWCKQIIGSKEYKVFISKEDPFEKLYYCYDCYNEMKQKGLIGGPS